jgi:peptidoglycan hydrolase-like protein with peptidoglycan-binding domain
MQTSDTQPIANEQVNPTADLQPAPNNPLNPTATAQLAKPILQLGSKGEEVNELQRLLTHWANYTRYSGVIDGIFDTDVRNAVIAYQHQMFLVEDGIVGNLTWQSLYKGAPLNMPTLKQGSKGSAVVTLQNVLKLTGDYRSKVDGDFGSLTKTAVQTFQKRVGLVVDGIVSDRTWHALSKVPH